MPRGLSTQNVPIFTTIAAALAAVLLTAGCGASGNTYTAPTTSAKCAVTTTAANSTLPSAGGAASIAVSTERECQWTASADGNWLTITGGASGQGPGTVDLAAAANSNPTTRTATVLINDQRVSLTQTAAACRFDLSETSAAVPGAGGRGSVGVRASNQACTWTASSNASWVSIASGASGTGSGTVNFEVAPAAGTSRTATLTVAGLPYTIEQSDACTYRITPTTYAAPAAGGATAVTVSAADGCPWTASSTASWVSLTPVAGTGSGSVNLTVTTTTGAARTGTATIAGQTFTVTQSQACTVAITPTSASLGAAGGSGRIDVTAGAGCGWAVASSAPWLSITSGATGSGTTAVLYSATANTGPARTASLSIADAIVTVTQAGGCTVSVTPGSQSAGSGGGPATVNVTAGAGCAWSAASNVAWIVVSSGSSGSGNGTVQLAIAVNGATAPRTGTVTIGGQTFTVTQAAATCSYSLSSSSQNVPASGGSGSFALTTDGACAWAASSDTAWIAVTPATGSGPATLTFTAAANTGSARSGTIGVGGQTFTITQGSGCTASITPDTLAVPAAASSRSVDVTTPSGCGWTAGTTATWVSVSPATGSGAGTVQIEVADNTGAPRTASATIAGRALTISQDGACTFAITPSTDEVGKDGGSGNVTVQAGIGCAWTAVSNVPWITIVSGATGSGDGVVKYTVDKNDPGAVARTGTLTIAGQTFTVTQKEGH